MIRKINKEKFSKLFLLIYSCFIAVSIIHHHYYNLDQSLTVNKNNETDDSALIDFLGDDHGVCAVNYFAQTISDSHFSADELESILTDLGINPPTKNISFKKQDAVNTNLLRAPPEIS
jgi:hypothetical protein